MSELRDLEMLRRRWRRARERLALVDETLGGFGRARLLAPVDPVTVRCVVLPADPEADTVEFDDAFWTRFVADTDEVPARRSRMWDREARPSAGAAILGRTYGGKCDRYVAVHRSGALEFCLGGDGARQWDERFRVFWMMPILCRVWEACPTSSSELHPVASLGNVTACLIENRTVDCGSFLSFLGGSWGAKPPMPSPEGRPPWGAIFRAIPMGPVGARGVPPMSHHAGTVVDGPSGPRDIVPGKTRRRAATVRHCLTRRCSVRN